MTFERIERLNCCCKTVAKHEWLLRECKCFFILNALWRQWWGNGLLRLLKMGNCAERPQIHCVRDCSIAMTSNLCAAWTPISDQRYLCLINLATWPVLAIPSADKFVCHFQIEASIRARSARRAVGLSRPNLHTIVTRRCIAGRPRVPFVWRYLARKGAWRNICGQRTR